MSGKAFPQKDGVVMLVVFQGHTCYILAELFVSISRTYFVP